MNKAISGMSLAAILFAAYLLVYRGSFTGSPDEYLLFDSTESFANRGNFNITYLNNREFDPQMIALTSGRPVNLKNHPVIRRIEAGEAPWRTAWYEPSYPLIASLFFWLAKQIDPFGLVHAVYLTNIFITIGTALLLYGGVMRMGDSVKTAWVTGLLFGIASNAYPFTQYNLREPLTGFFSLGCFIIALDLQRNWHPGKFILMGLFFAAGLATKVTVVFILPGLLLALMPPVRQILSYRRFLITILGLMAVGFLFLLWLSSIEGSRDRLNLPFFKMVTVSYYWRYALKSLIGYQVSFARSIWLYSPVLLLGIPLAYKQFKQGEGRFSLVIIVSIFVASIGYGLSRANHWAGGTLAYGPRYLLFLLPVMYLWIAPAVKQVFASESPQRWRLVGRILIIISVLIQVIGVLYHSTRYFEAVFSPGVAVWNIEGTPPIGQSQPYMNLRFLLDGVTPDIAWIERADPGWLIPLAALLVLAFGIGLSYWVFHRENLPEHFTLAAASLLLILAAGSVCGTLYSLRHDPIFSQGREDIPALLSELNHQVRADDLVVISSLNFVEPFMNYFKAGVLAVKIQDSPGERHNPDGIPLLVSDDPAKLLGPGAALTLDWAAQHYNRIWITMPYGPFVSYALRPEEHYMAERYFPISRIEPSQFARAILFDTTPAPQGEPENKLDVTFEDGLVLHGVNFPKGTAYGAGEVIPVSLVWQPEAKISFDYNISLQLLSENGSVAAQADGQPQGTFGYMSRWEPGMVYRDNYGMQLSETLPTGIYTLQVVVYNWQNRERLGLAGIPGEKNSVALAEISVQ